MTRLLIERDTELPGLMTVTLNRPEKLNALDVETHDELQALCRDLADDPHTRVVIFTGAGRAFSAGADLASARPGRAENELDRRLRVHIGGRTSAMLERLEQVTIGAVNGLAVGGAVVLLSCLDMRLAAKQAWFSIPEVELNLPLTWNSIPRLMRELGPARTKELILACDRFSADDAERWGFVNHVYPAARVMPEARKLAQRLLSMEALTLAMTKSAANAVARTMAPDETTWSDADLMLFAYRRLRDQQRPAGDAAAAAAAGGQPRTSRKPASRPKSRTKAARAPKGQVL